MTKADILIARITKRYLTRLPMLRACRHSELSIICASDDDAGPNKFLVDVSLQAVEDARASNLKALSERNKSLPDSVYYEVFPGEHYRLLQSLVRTFAPKSIIEIGTFTGMSSASMLCGMPENCSITTFDINPWGNHRSHLTEADFSAGRIKQVLDDLSDPKIFSKYVNLFSNSQLIFCDAPKDGVFEHKFLSNLATVKPQSPTILVLDDTRLLNMIDVWRSIQSPKLDLTSFGHWAGTGLVDISDGLKVKAY
jgi:predicted O-methyltransferase YrrM